MEFLSAENWLDDWSWKYGYDGKVTKSFKYSRAYIFIFWEAYNHGII